VEQGQPLLVLEAMKMVRRGACCRAVGGQCARSGTAAARAVRGADARVWCPPSLSPAGACRAGAAGWGRHRPAGGGGVADWGGGGAVAGGAAGGGGGGGGGCLVPPAGNGWIRRPGWQRRAGRGMHACTNFASTWRRTLVHAPLFSSFHCSGRRCLSAGTMQTAQRNAPQGSRAASRAGSKSRWAEIGTSWGWWASGAANRGHHGHRSRGVRQRDCRRQQSSASHAHCQQNSQRCACAACMPPHC